MSLSRYFCWFVGALLLATACSSSTHNNASIGSGPAGTGPAGISIPAECGQLAGTAGLDADGGILLTTCSEFFGPAFEMDASSTAVVAAGTSCPTEKALCACLRIDRGPPTNCTLDVTYDVYSISKNNCDPDNCKAGPAPGGQTVVFATTLSDTADAGTGCPGTTTHVASSCDQVQGQQHTCTDVTLDFQTPNQTKAAAAAAGALNSCKSNSGAAFGTPSCSPCPVAGKTASCSVCDTTNGQQDCKIQNVYTDSEATDLQANCYSAVGGPVVVFTDYRTTGSAGAGD